MTGVPGRALALLAPVLLAPVLLAAVLLAVALPVLAGPPPAAGGTPAAVPPASGATGGTSGGGTWTPVYNEDFPDPAVMPYGGVLYAYSTETVAATIPGARSLDALHWQTLGDDIFPALPPFAGGGRTWAPSVEPAADGRFVMYYTAADPSSGDQCIGEATSPAPTGPFVDTNSGFVVCQHDLGGSIDPQIFQYPGGAALLWKSDGNAMGQPTHLWSAPLSPDLTLTGAAPTLLLSDDQGWQAGVVEGPAMVEVGGSYDLFYGAGGYATSGYSIGEATCAGPFGPCSDHGTPVLTSQPGETGPGGPSFFSLGGQLLMAFDAWPGVVGYPAGGYRALYMADVTFHGGVASFTPSNARGYWLVAGDGGMFSFSNPFFGSMGGHRLNQPVVGMAATSDGGGYWEVAADGGIFAFGDARFAGSMGGRPLNEPIVGITADPATGGYWEVAADGGLFAFDAPFFGSTGGRPLNQPVVGMAATADGRGYWLVARDGGIFAFGDARFAGSTGGHPLNQPVVGMSPDFATGGYWLVAADGGIFSFDAPFFGSTGGIGLRQPVVGMEQLTGGQGYWLVAADGGIFAFGQARFLGSTGGLHLNSPVVGMS